MHAALTNERIPDRLARALNDAHEPGGAPARRKSSSTQAPECGVSSEGFKTTALPAAIAVAVWVKGMLKGKFQGERIATTPTGS